MNQDDNVIQLKHMEISDSDSEDYNYAAIHELEEDNDDEDLDNFHSLLTSLDSHPSTIQKEENPLDTEIKPSVVDDFIRNVFIKIGMKNALDAFNTEWYEMKRKGLLQKEDDSENVPNVYVQNQELGEEVKALKVQIEKMSAITAKAKGTWDKFRKERDFHRMHHKRVVQEKKALMTDIKRLKKHYASYEPTIKELRSKYEIAMKEKMMMRLEKDRSMAKVKGLEIQMSSMEVKEKHAKVKPNEDAKSKTKKKKEMLRIPNEPGTNPFTSKHYPPPNAERYVNEMHDVCSCLIVFTKLKNMLDI